MMNITELRAEIDKIDGEIIPLLEKRLDTCYEIARFKARTNQPYYDEAREAEKLATIAELTRDALDDEVLEIYGEIMRICREYQRNLMGGKDATDD